MNSFRIHKIVWGKHFPILFFISLALLLSILVKLKVNSFISLSSDAITALLTINGILLGFVSSTMSNVLTISSSEIMEKMKRSFNSKKVSRYDELIMVINNARFWNLLSLCGGMLLLILPVQDLKDISCFLKAFFIALIIVSIFTFYLATSLVDKTLENV